MAHILVVEELTSNIIDVKTSLRDHDLLLVKTIQQALDELANMSFDVIICAVHLETGSVFDLLKFVRNSAEHRGTPFVFFCNAQTPLAQLLSETVEATAKLLGADEYLSGLQLTDAQLRHSINTLLWKQTRTDQHLRFVGDECARAQQTLSKGQPAEAEHILKLLLEEMTQHSERYPLLDVASVQFELAEVLDVEGKVDEARLSRESFQDF